MLTNKSIVMQYDCYVTMKMSQLIVTQQWQSRYYSNATQRLNMSQYWRGKIEEIREIPVPVPFYPAQILMNWPRHEPVLRGKRPAINRLSHATTDVQWHTFVSVTMWPELDNVLTRAVIGSGSPSLATVCTNNLLIRPSELSGNPSSRAIY
jgi:hypothetical protein